MGKIGKEESLELLFFFLVATVSQTIVRPKYTTLNRKPKIKFLVFSEKNEVYKIFLQLCVNLQYF